MKILMVIDSLDKGGKERRMLELIKGLIRREEGFQIYLVSLTDKVEYKYVYDLPIKFEILRRRYKKDPGIVFRLRKIIKSFQPDIIHSWSTMASVYLSLANLFTRKPMINAVLADAHDKLNFSDKHYLRVKLTTPFSDAFVANSLAGIRSYRTPENKSICIYNGIDFNRFLHLRPKAEIESEVLGRHKDGLFIVGMVASFDERKDFGTLIRAAVKMCGDDQTLVFLLVGTGPGWELSKRCVPFGLLDRQIIFTGKRDDVESILQIIDLGILLTNAENHGEGISNSIIEYMALGKPVIASRGGGTSEVVKDNFNGYLVDPKNEDQIIEKIYQLQTNRELRESLGRNAFQWVRDQFDVDKKTGEYVDLYKRLSSRK